MALSEEHRHGHALRRARKLHKALKHFAVLIEKDPRDAEALFGHGIVRADLKDFTGAIADFETALKLDPNSAQVLRGLARCHVALGDFEQADPLYRRALDADPGHTAGYYQYSLARKFTPDDLPLVERIEALTRRKLTPAQASYLHFAAGKMLDDMGDAERAFPHFQKGNTAREAKFDPRAHERMVERHLRFVTPELMQAKADQGLDDDRFVFIIGMPRSGTTLAERILGAHADAYPAGELQDMSLVAQAVGRHLDPPAEYPAYMDRLDGPVMTGFGRAYAKRVTSLAPGHRKYIDKHPLNFWRAPLIRLLINPAPIIAMRRNPLDVCLSNYFVKYARGHPYSYDLEHLAFVYALYEKMMDHWRAAGTRIVDTAYEDLVSDPGTQGPALAAAAGLDWQADMLEKFPSGGTIATASKWQARQPLYTSSIGKARHYDQFLGPLKAALDRYGVAY